MGTKEEYIQSYKILSLSDLGKRLEQVYNMIEDLEEKEIYGDVFESYKTESSVLEKLIKEKSNE